MDTLPWEAIANESGAVCSSDEEDHNVATAGRFMRAAQLKPNTYKYYNTVQCEL